MFNHLQNPEANPFGQDLAAVAVDTAPACTMGDRRAQWATVLKGGVLFTAMAVKARDWAKVQQGEELVTMASDRSGLDSALLRGIFGGEVPAVDSSNRLLAACFEAGLTASAEQVREAREVMRANKAARESASRAASDARRASEHAQRGLERAMAAAERTNQAKTAGMVVGAEFDATWLYRQAKRDVASITIDGVEHVVEMFHNHCAGAGRVRVTRVGGRRPQVEAIK